MYLLLPGSFHNISLAGDNGADTAIGWLAGLALPLSYRFALALVLGGCVWRWRCRCWLRLTVGIRHSRRCSCFWYRRNDSCLAGNMGLLTAIGLTPGGSAGSWSYRKNHGKQCAHGLVILVLSCGLIRQIGRLLNIADLLLIEPCLSSYGASYRAGAVLLSIGLCADGLPRMAGAIISSSAWIAS